MRADTGLTTITTSGTAVRVNNIPDRIKSIQFKNPQTSTGTVYVGRSDVEGSGTVNGWPLEVGEESPVWSFGEGSVKFSVWWADSTVSGDKVAWAVIYETGEDS